MKYKCDICKSYDTVVKPFTSVIEINRSTYKLVNDRRFCSKCGNPVYDPVLDNNILKDIIRKKEEILGIEPNKIISLRKKYNLTQEQFSKIIGCAKKTLISYEKGTSIPNDIYLIILKMLLDNPEVIRLLIDSNNNRYSTDEYKDINNRIGEINLKNKNRKLTVYNGYKEFSEDKLCSIIQYLTKDTMLKTKLLKELFYIDFLYYKNTAQSLTGLEYVKYPYGPVPDGYEEILNKLVNKNIIDIKYNTNGNYESYEITSDYYDNNLNIDELRIVNKVKDFFDKYSVSEIVEFSHKEKAFLNTKQYNKIEYDFAFDINL